MTSASLTRGSLSPVAHHCLKAALALTVACVIMTAFAALPAAASGARVAIAPGSSWISVPLPAGAPWSIQDVSCFGQTGLVLAGDGHVAYSRDAGGTWSVIVPPGQTGTAYTAAAFNGSGDGVIASGGLLLVTHDWGANWAPPAYVDSGPTSGIRDVVMRGAHAIAVGGGGMILASSDNGATWQTEASPATADLTSVALASDGTAVAGSAAGDVLVRRAAWAVTGILAEPVTSVAAAPTIVWSDGQPDLFAATGHDVLGSDDGVTFESLSGLPDLTQDSRPQIAWTGQPERSLLAAGALAAGFLSSSGVWVSAASTLDGLVDAAAPGGQSVAYLLDAGSHLARTLSAGREPASVQLSRRRIVTGTTARLSATVSIGAPGSIFLQTRVPGRTWSTLRRIDWSASDWGRTVRFDVSPTLNRDYVLEFRYGGTRARISPVLSLTAVPKVKTDTSRYDLRRGSVFRFSGSVSPRLRGERVQLFTDRGGSWRPVSLQPAVELVDGRIWESRRFGTPKAETYRLRAHLARTSTHGEAWSRIVTVTIR